MHLSKLMIYHLICTNLIKFSLEYSKISTIIQHPGVVVWVHLPAVRRARQPRRVTVHRAAHGRLRPWRPWKDSGIPFQENIILNSVWLLLKLIDLTWNRLCTIKQMSVNENASAVTACHEWKRLMTCEYDGMAREQYWPGESPYERWLWMAQQRGL